MIISNGISEVVLGAQDRVNIPCLIGLHDIPLCHLVEIDKDNRLRVKIYDKQDDINFDIVLKFPVFMW